MLNMPNNLSFQCVHGLATIEEIAYEQKLYACMLICYCIFEDFGS